MKTYNYCENGCLYQQRCQDYLFFVDPNVSSCGATSNTICSETNCVLNEGMNVQSDGSFLLKVGGLILESGKYFAFAGESRHELYRDMTLEQKGQLRSNEYAFDVFIHNDDSNDVNARSKSLYGEFKIMVDPEKKTVIFEQNYESVDFVPVIENIPVGSNGGLWDYGRIENGFPTIHIPTESNHLRNVFRYKNFNLRYLRNRKF